MGFKSDIEIAQEAELMHINEIAKIAGVSEDYLESIKRRWITTS